MAERRRSNLPLILAVGLAVWWYGLGGYVPVSISIPAIVPSGERDVVILRESADDTPAFGLLLNALRVGEPSKYLTEKSHTLTVYDPHDKDASGQTPPLVAKLVAEGVTLPALFVLDRGGVVRHKQPLPATADEVLSAIKRGGG